MIAILVVLILLRLAVYNIDGYIYSAFLLFTRKYPLQGYFMDMPAQKMSWAKLGECGFKIDYKKDGFLALNCFVLCSHCSGVGANKVMKR